MNKKYVGFGVITIAIMLLMNSIAFAQSEKIFRVYVAQSDSAKAIRKQHFLFRQQKVTLHLFNKEIIRGNVSEINDSAFVIDSIAYKYVDINKLTFKVNERAEQRTGKLIGAGIIGGGIVLTTSLEVAELVVLSNQLNASNTDCNSCTITLLGGVLLSVVNVVAAALTTSVGMGFLASSATTQTFYLNNSSRHFSKNYAYQVVQVKARKAF